MRVLVAAAAVVFAIGAPSAVGGCNSSSSGAGGAGTPACTSADGTACPTGAGVLQLCVTSDGDQCGGAFFKIGAQTVTCNSCIDTSACAEQAATVCFGDAGLVSSSGGSLDSGSGSSSGGSDASSD
jgi:hypothetical protein